MGTISLSPYSVSSSSAFTPFSAIFPGKCSNAALIRPGVNSRTVYRTTSKPCRFATRPQLLATEPGGYSFSQNGTKSRSAARTTGSISGTPMNRTSCPRDCSLRASAVIGFRCPVSGRLRKPIFIVAPITHSVNHSLIRSNELQNFGTGQYLSELPQWLFQASRDHHFFEDV